MRPSVFYCGSFGMLQLQKTFRSPLTFSTIATKQPCSNSTLPPTPFETIYVAIDFSFTLPHPRSLSNLHEDCSVSP
jgi:hypothetical protein